MKCCQDILQKNVMNHLLNINQSVAVIGGGIAGCSAAHALAQRGFLVSLFERNETVASEASGNPVGLLYPRLSGENDLSEFALSAYLYANHFYQALALKEKIFKRCGMLQLGFNAKDQARINKVAANIAPDIAKFLSKNEASTIAGIPLSHDALYFPDAAWLNPIEVCNQLASQNNISLFTSTIINKILKNNDLFEIYDKENLIGQFDIVVIANAHDALKFTQTAHLQTQSVRGQLTQLKSTTTSAALKTSVCSDGYLTPAIDGTHCLGATFSVNDANLKVTHIDHLQNLNKLKQMSETLYADLEHKISNGRTAFRCASLDHFPLVGEMLEVGKLTENPPRPSALANTLPWHANLYVNIAHGSHGLMTAPISAEILATMINAEPLPIDQKLVGLLNPNRFALRNLGLKKMAKNVANKHADNLQTHL